ncbi:hypothetical protein D6779_03070, partial [Candidatus Parcubacteria bacterium]
EELQNREEFMRGAVPLFANQDMDERSLQQGLKTLSRSVLLTGHSSLSTMVNDAIKWDGLIPLIRQLQEHEEPPGEDELNGIVEDLGNTPFRGRDGNPKQSEAGYFLSLLLQARWPDHFVEYRQSRINALAKRLGFAVPTGPMGKRLVKAGELAKEVRELPTFRELWGGHPYPNVVVATLAYAGESSRWDEFIRPGEDHAQAEPGVKKESLMKPGYSHPKNQILYGPPGTGKTYQTRRMAVEVCDGAAPDTRQELNQRYHELYEQGRIRFVTFHQSFSYEDFVEGIRPVMEGAEGNGLRYKVEDGIFKRICAAASQPVRKGTRLQLDKDLMDRKYLKMSIGGQQDPDIEEYCLENGIIALGWGGDVDYSKYKTISSPYQKGFEEIRRAMADHGHEPESKFAIQAVWFFRDYMQEG